MLTNYLSTQIQTVYAKQPWYGKGVLVGTVRLQALLVTLLLGVTLSAPASTDGPTLTLK